MKKVIALSAVLVLGALGMACGDSGANNSAKTNKMVANAMNAANSAMANASNQLANANAQVSNAMNAINSSMANANAAKANTTTSTNAANANNSNTKK